MCSMWTCCVCRCLHTQTSPVCSVTVIWEDQSLQSAPETILSQVNLLHYNSCCVHTYVCMFPITGVCVCGWVGLGVSAGQCMCKEGFTGRRCDRCAFGYRDFPQCIRCECNLSGSTNTDPCSPCTCKVNSIIAPSVLQNHNYSFVFIHSSRNLFSLVASGHDVSLVLFSSGECDGSSLWSV